MISVHDFWKFGVMSCLFFVLGGVLGGVIVLILSLLGIIGENGVFVILMGLLGICVYLVLWDIGFLKVP